ncbi:XcbB/CpsF family capsular polysaccharide biosynthesis protein [Oerskovia rustica]|uniref:XcbB/CpsF family capsular polysaccharide biosynthesis protein n=1 Tax=Oerskovia rustica TaxID=2762237 RepID=A0ABR8RT18_9CELL|nr:XcbB/CpsF family capsular polysaccharide biosynthesis protein [Oerskovia rustica]MBD7950941.1 XcbB/CpsF family capsular polysaccharide biosynthesis protein [Oerskovia rustica]
MATLENPWTNRVMLDTLDANPQANFLHLRRADISTQRNFVTIGVRDLETHTMVKTLASRGYLHYMASEGESRFVHQRRLSTLWKAVIDGDLSVSDNGAYYSLELPSEVEPRRLLVLFSSIYAPPTSASLWRYMARNYQHVNSSIPDDTAILRIADVGGVLGAFYLDTTAMPTNSAVISGLIEQTINELGIPRSSAVLLGPSKGGTGATFHGLRLGLPFVAVDPILDDTHYEQEMSDAHFTGHPVFPAAKQAVFGNLFAQVLETYSPGEPRGLFVTSPRSAQYPIVIDAARALAGVVSVMTADSPRIKSHPDVARVTLGPTLSLVNSLLCGWPTPRGFFSV